MVHKSFNALNMLAAALGSIPKVPYPIPNAKNYPLYLRENTLSIKELEAQRNDAKTEDTFFSVVVNALGFEIADIGCTLITLFAQTYSRFEAIIAVDENCDLIKSQNYPRIKSVVCGDGSLAHAQGSIAGDAVIVLYAGDRLSPDALFSFANKLREKPDIRLIYADNDRIEKGERVRPQFKPSYSPVSEFCFDYVQRPLCVRSALHARTGGFTGRYDQHEYTLRCFKEAGGAEHISKILLTVKHNAERISLPAPPKGFESLPGLFAGSSRFLCEKPSKGGAAIIIPDADDAEELKSCLEQIDTLSIRRPHEIVIGVGKRPDEKLEAYLDRLIMNKAAKVIKLFKNGSSNVPAVINECASRVYADYYVFLSASAKIESGEFIDELLCPLVLDAVGISGGKLLDNDGKIHHSGYVIGVGGWAGSLYRGTADDRHDLRKCFYTAMQRNVSAVSGAFMAVSAENFLKIGMLDESLGLVGWDVEFCLRAAERGLSTVYTPYASAKLGKIPISFTNARKEDLARCYEVLRDTLISGDPYYNIAYDCRFDMPIVSINPAKPILLNPNF